MFTLNLLLTTAGVVHPTLTDGALPSRDLAEALTGQRLFVQAFTREPEARVALQVVIRALTRLSEAGLLGGVPGPSVEGLSAALNPNEVLH